MQLALVVCGAAALAMAGAGVSPEEAWRAHLERYARIVRSAERSAMPEGSRQEALDIVSKFRVLVTSPVYETPSSAVIVLQTEAKPEVQARILLGLLKNMGEIQRTLSRPGPQSRARKAELFERYMNDRANILELLDSMAAAARRLPVKEQRLPRGY
ncbi:MAG: hypothetical protein HY922_15460 [Elusimicrobia bacterium]|nr:hypothetical protein [Elusimicrobiota bacterium]